MHFYSSFINFHSLQGSNFALQQLLMYCRYEQYCYLHFFSDLQTHDSHAVKNVLQLRNVVTQVLSFVYMRNVIRLLLLAIGAASYLIFNLSHVSFAVYSFCITGNRLSPKDVAITAHNIRAFLVWRACALAFSFRGSFSVLSTTPCIFFLSSAAMTKRDHNKKFLLWFPLHFKCVLCHEKYSWKQRNRGKFTLLL